MEEVYSAADFAIGRSGAASLVELAVLFASGDPDSVSYAITRRRTRRFSLARAQLLLANRPTAELLAQNICELIEN